MSTFSETCVPEAPAWRGLRFVDTRRVREAEISRGLEDFFANAGLSARPDGGRRPCFFSSSPPSTRRDRGQVEGVRVPVAAGIWRPRRGGVDSNAGWRRKERRRWG